MELIYTERQADSISATEWEELSALTRSAFSEHKAKGLNMLPSYADGPRLARFLEDCQLILALNKTQIIAIYAYAIHRLGRSKFIDLRIAAISPQCKRMGIGRKMFNHVQKKAEEAGCLYLQTDTSCKAKSSRAYHQSCGFENWYYTHWRTTNYYSIVMRKELPPGKRMPRFQRYKSLVQSYLSVHFRYNTEGQERSLYYRLKALLRKKS